MKTHLFKIIALALVIITCTTGSNHIIKTLHYWQQPSMYASLISDFQNLERLEKNIVKILTQAFLASDKFPSGSPIRHLVHVYLNDFYESNGYTDIEDAIKNEDIRISPNPICAYRLLWRIKFLLEDIRKHKNFLRHFGPLGRKIGYFYQQFGWPSIQDFQALAEKILRIQHVYDLNVEKFANGCISPLHTNCTLNTIHCYEIAKVATKTEQFASAIEWLELAKEKAEWNTFSSPAFLQMSLWNAIEKHNNEFDPEMKLDLEPLFFDRKISHSPYDSKNATKLRNIQIQEFKGRKELYYTNINYLALCSGESFQTEKEKAILFCWYEHKIHISFAIGGIKMEFLSKNPDIVQMYDVLHDSESQQVIGDCSPSVLDGGYKVVNYQFAPKSTQVSGTSFHISSLYSWCRPSNTRQIEGKLERITGLAVEGKGSEDFRVLSYSVGGHIQPHFDKVQGMEYFKTLHKFRFASLMLYLSDVEQGGETVFTSVGINAQPIKGSVVLWFNFYPDGREDLTTYHGGCPVRFGTKWASNKWLVYGTQFLKQKCGNQSNERLQFPVNNVLLPIRRDTK